MAIENKTTCDVCGSKMECGYQVSNFGERQRGAVSDRLERPAQFCCLLCLSVWSDRAQSAADDMIKHARSLHPHGTFSEESVPALVVY